MDLNSVLFPAPRSSYSVGKIYGELVWIPRRNSEEPQIDVSQQCILPESRPSCSTAFQSDTKERKAKNLDRLYGFELKPLTKEPESETNSFVSTASSKIQAPEAKFARESKAKSKKDAFCVTGKALDENSVPCKPYLTDFMAKRNSVQEGRIDISRVFVKEGNADFLLDENYKKIPQMTGFENSLVKYNVTETDDRMLTSDRMTANKPIFYDQPLKPQNQKSTNSHQKAQSISLTKSKHFRQDSSQLHSVENKNGSHTVSKQMLFNDKSQSNFELASIDENVEIRGSVCSPRTLPNYCTKTKLNPERKVNKLTLAEINENVGIEFDFLKEHIQEHLAPSSTRLRYEGYQSRKAVNTHKNPRLTTSLLSPAAAYERASLSQSFCNQDDGTKLVSNTTLTKKEVTKSETSHIPCLLLRSRVCSGKILVYFHGNGEDINLAKDLLRHLRDVLQVNVLAVEYPGYGLYKGTPSESNILEDSESVYEYLVTNLKIHPSEIIVFGRSIGSGPATYIASKNNVAALILVSPFTSIKAVAKDIMGAWAQHLIKERFNNIEAIKNVSCPTFIVHGQRDRLVPFQHSKQLHEACHAPSELVLPNKMSHTEFDFNGDFTEPLMQFLKKCNIDLEPKGISGKIYFPKKLFEKPVNLNKKESVKVTKV